MGTDPGSLHPWGELAPGENEGLIPWCSRALAELRRRMDAEIASGHEAHHLRILVPPKFLAMVYSVVYACRIDEAIRKMEDELRRDGFFVLVNAVVELANVAAPCITVFAEEVSPSMLPSAREPRDGRSRRAEFGV